ncbi:nucleolar and spindle-associated protein 1 isoform X2 [Stigmatopora nigra]
MDLDSLNYADLRKLAKQLNLKANMKAPRLLNAIKKVYEQQKDTDTDKVEEMESDTPAEMKPEDTNEVSVKTAFVSTRRGKVKRQNKRSQSDVKIHDEVVDEMVPLVQTHKKRRVSTKAETETNEENVILIQSSNVDEAGKVPLVAKPCKISRTREKRTALKAVTPNFQKLHNAHFDKMESIDDYLQRKNIKKMAPVQETKVAKTARVSLFSPAPHRKKNEVQSQNKMADKGKDVVFKPNVISTRRINIRFSEATLGNEHKRSLTKTPANFSLALATSTPCRATPQGRKSAITPSAFVFTGNTSATPGTQKKAVFDLKASLARPLTYKPHTGKLKPLGDEKPVTKTSLVESRKQNYKQHRVQTREERLLKQAEERQAKKANLLFARRGLAMD